MARSPLVILHALRFLLKSDDKESRQIFWNFLEQGRFSESDAAALLQHHPDFARHLLKDSSASPLRTRLLHRLSRYLDLPEYIVKTGYFVLCDVGWGKILEIRGSQQKMFFIVGEETPALLIELLHWSEQQAEPDLTSRRIQILRAKRRQPLQLWAVCRFRMRTNPRLFGNDTASYADKTNRCPAARFILAPNQPVYCAGRPENPFDTRSGE